MGLEFIPLGEQRMHPQKILVGFPCRLGQASGRLQNQPREPGSLQCRGRILLGCAPGADDAAGHARRPPVPPLHQLAQRADWRCDSLAPSAQQDTPGQESVGSVEDGAPDTPVAGPSSDICAPSDAPARRRERSAGALVRGFGLAGRPPTRYASVGWAEERPVGVPPGAPSWRPRWAATAAAADRRPVGATGASVGPPQGHR